MDLTYLAVSIASVSFSGGVLVGLFTSKFVAKKECDRNRAALWDQVDAIRNCMTGGRVRFELRMIQDKGD